MGTNFYWKVGDDGLLFNGLEPPEDRWMPQQHIGKRSAAGKYCWDCNVTLCQQGTDGLHQAGSTFYETCPKCGKGPLGNHNSAMVELGFQKPAQERSRGVQGCASFSFAQPPEDVYALCERFSDAVVIEDEYGREMTGNDFRLMLEMNCPVRMVHSIGVEFG